MAFPGIGTLTLDDTLTQIRGAATRVRQRSSVVRDRSLGAATQFSEILAYVADLRSLRVQLVALAATPGLPAFSQTQLGNPSLDIVAEYNAMVAALDSTVSWIAANLPKDANGYLLQTFMNASTGQTTERTFTSAELAVLRQRLDALIATISA